MSGSHLDATSIVVQRYDAALKEIARLKKDNHELREIIRGNEIKAMNLIGHYSNEIEAQTNALTSLKDEVRAREELELIKRQRKYQDQSTGIEDDELQSKENELLQIIYMLEDEIKSLKDDRAKQARDFQRKSIRHQASVKQSFLRDIDSFRSEISNSLCEEVREALVDTVADNERLTHEFRMLLGEMEKLQASRERKDKELVRTKREMEFLVRRNQLMASRIQHQTETRHEERIVVECEEKNESYDVSATRDSADSGLEGTAPRFAYCLAMSPLPRLLGGLFGSV
ncbi:hypothetical protein ACHAWF_015631 [Thalassiosira exigua]